MKPIAGRFVFGCLLSAIHPSLQVNLLAKRRRSILVTSLNLFLPARPRLTAQLRIKLSIKVRFRPFAVLAIW